MVDLGDFAALADLQTTSLAPSGLLSLPREGQFRAKLRNMIAIGIQAAKVNVGYFYNCKGLVAEILSESFQQSVLAERQQAHPNARLFNDVYVSREGVGDPVLFTDGLIGYTEGDRLTITDRFEVKSGPAGGEQAARQYFKWVESHMEDGTELLLNKRPALPGETPGPGQKHIGKMIYDVYYWKPASPQPRSVTGLSGAGALHAIMPEGGTILSRESGDNTVPITIQELPATASEINYLARLMIEQVVKSQASSTPSLAVGRSDILGVP